MKSLVAEKGRWIPRIGNKVKVIGLCGSNDLHPCHDVKLLNCVAVIQEINNYDLDSEHNILVKFVNSNSYTVKFGHYSESELELFKIVETDLYKTAEEYAGKYTKQYYRKDRQQTVVEPKEELIFPSGKRKIILD